MNYAIILAGGTGVRMKSSGVPKQFLTLMGKPIIIYTLEIFENCKVIDKIIIPCNEAWIDVMNGLIEQYRLNKIMAVVGGGRDRQASIVNGLNVIRKEAKDSDIIIIHDGVRPLLQEEVIYNNIRDANIYGAAMTVKESTESLVITSQEEVQFNNFMKRADTYLLTSPQTFRYSILADAYNRSLTEDGQSRGIPLLDAALLYTSLGNEIHMVHDLGSNIKITTPEDFYFAKSIMELTENKKVLGM